MLLAHRGMEVSGGQILRMRLVGTPLHEEAVTDAAQQTCYEHGWRTANPAPVVVVRNVQPLVQAIIDAAEASLVEFQPSPGVEFVWFSAGQQSDVLLLAALGLAQQSGSLRHQRKANLLRGDALS